MNKLLIAVLLISFAACGDVASTQFTTSQNQDQGQAVELDPAGETEGDDICDCVQQIINESPDNLLQSECPDGTTSTITDSVFTEALDSCNDARIAAGCDDNCGGVFE